MQDLKNKFIDFAKRESTFLCLAVGWLFFAIILPIIFINNKYKLFVKTDGDLRFTGWALVGLLVLFIGLYALCSYVIDAYSVKYRTWVKLLKGFQRIILPLLILFFMCGIINTNIQKIENLILEIIISESIAIIINPFPYFVYKHKNADAREVYGLGGKD